MKWSEDKQADVISKDELILNYELLKAYLPFFASTGPPPVEQHKATKLNISEAAGYEAFGALMHAELRLPLPSLQLRRTSSLQSFMKGGGGSSKFEQLG